MKTSINYKKLFGLIANYFSRYRIPITVGLIVLLFSASVIRINQLSNPEADSEKVTEALSTYKAVSIDEETVENIRQLIESDVQIEPRFNNRTNPFAE